MGNIAVLLLAAGSGRRFGGDIPKQYQEVNGVPLLLHTLLSLQEEARICWLQPVIGAGDHLRFSAAVADNSFDFNILPPVIGGSERALSMALGLQSLPPEVTMVAVHDAARPLPSARLLRLLFDAAEAHGAAVPGLAVTDTIKEVDEHGVVVRTLDRHRLRAVQTPQVARREWFEQAIAHAGDRLADFTDDVSLLESVPFPVHITLGEARNRKITTVADLRWMEEELRHDTE
ncbi:MAG: 2-C-methyl-D-erythritol 4-phosphate cytidylyltransferase [Mariprofundales bacterium]